MGLVWKVCEPGELQSEVRRHAEILASKPISSLVAVKQSIAEPTRAGVVAARALEDGYFAEMMGAQANADALAEFNRPS
jgi:enoyl-CoA hydratase/carnithine racemase